MTQSPTPRRTSSQWQALVDQWKQSGLSARTFCQEQDVGYASFCQWRKRFADATSDREAAGSAPAFIDLASLRQASPQTRTGWNIVLSLGNGVELKLSQG